MNTKTIGREGGNSLKPEEEEKKVYLVCNDDGDVIEVVSAGSFEEAYENTIELNNGAFLAEVDRIVFEEIEKKLKHEVRL